MTPAIKRCFGICLLAMACCLGAAGQAAADSCQLVDTWCWQCLPDSSNGCCQNSGPCGCFDVQCFTGGAGGDKSVEPLQKPSLAPATTCQQTTIAAPVSRDQEPATPRRPAAAAAAPKLVTRVPGS
jgi:hypothetical protein